jgi:hypothetical protein
MSLAWTGTLSLAAPDPKAKPAPTELEARLTRSFNAIEAANRDLPRDHFDPQAVLETIGREPQQLFAFVKNQTRYVPYDGRLRGATGVLMDRMGNSLDRGILMATLLQAAGFEVRLAHGTITPEQAATLIAAPATADAPEAADEASEIKRYADKFGLNADSISKRLKAARVDADRMAEDAMARVTQQTPILAGAVGKIEPASTAASTAYWWAEAKDGDAWTAYDPAADAPGKALAAASETLALDKLPAEQNHRLAIRVTVEQWDGGKLNEKKVLDETVASADVVGTPIQLVHNPLKWQAKLDLIESADIAAVLKEKLTGQTEWMPVLWVGKKPTAKASFRTDGTINEKPQMDPAASLGGAAGGAFGGLGGVTTGDAPKGEPTALTAEWIDYTIHTPGRPDRTIRRQVFDLIGPAARAAGVSQKPGGEDDARRLAIGMSLSGSTDIFVQANWLAPEFVQQQLLAETLKNKDAFLTVAREAGPKGPVGQDAVSLNATSGSDLPSLAMARYDWSKQKRDVYLDSINVLTYHSMMKPSDKDGIVGCEGYDIVANDVAVRPGIEAGQARLAQGVLDTAAEALIIGRCGKVHNTSELTAVSPNDWQLVRSPDALASAASQLPADVQKRIAQDLAAGYAVLLPKAVPADHSPAWWRIDPMTGNALGFGENGWGAAMTETAWNNVRIALNVLDMILCTYSAMSVKNEAGKAAAMLVCMAKGSLKGTKLLISKPAQMGTGLVIDLMGDFISAIIAPGAKAVFS